MVEEHISGRVGGVSGEAREEVEREKGKGGARIIIYFQGGKERQKSIA